MRISKLRCEIRAHWKAIVERANVRIGALTALPITDSKIALLGSSTKTVKGRGLGIDTRIVYMAPHREAFRLHSNRTMCPNSTVGCALACLGNSAGRMAWEVSANARLWKTALFVGDRKRWRALLKLETEALARSAERSGYVAAVRVDGSSDTGEGFRLAGKVPAVQCYDYSKRPSVVRAYLKGRFPKNYHLTFSRSGSAENTRVCVEVLIAGMGVAVIFGATPAYNGRNGGALPATYAGFPVIDGDRSDARWLDRSEFSLGSGGYIVGLRFKQLAAIDHARTLAVRRGFVAEGHASV